ncbi:hypothetical protein E4U17_005580 [Claviceps sp. LM77 group G4]|nr:hypothetical protein E4U17_005580 [Claviceps sp. LM77 group G4]KAG6052692.1 hypothetical protein E4U33_000413 [Claviceps sp. LM78 group G4]KAG6070951.1 hypothetical protein E4U16_006483 [Claviceps sp. LM84 group G4]
MASGPSSRDAATSPTIGAIDDFETREAGASTEPLDSSAVRAIEVSSIEVGSPADDEFDSSSLEDDDGTASVASSTISVRTYERGRPYMIVGDGRYPIPSDELEQNREDMKHAMLMMVTENKPFLSPVGDHPQKILDIGTGTGIWAVEVGDRYPSAKVRGIDIAPIQPAWVPVNVTFLVDDCEQDWIERDVDLAHFRFTIATLKNTSQVLGHAFRSLRPGGWIELQELLPTPLCDDGTMPDNDPVKYLYEKIERAFEKFGMRAQLPAELEPFLHEAGFENIHCQIFKVPIGSWAKDRTMRIVGLYQKMAVVDVLPIFSGPFQALGMSEAEIEVMNAMARKGLDDPKVYRYFNYYFWYAQKPRSLQIEQDTV